VKMGRLPMKDTWMHSLLRSKMAMLPVISNILFMLMKAETKKDNKRFAHLCLVVRKHLDNVVMRYSLSMISMRYRNQLMSHRELQET